MKLPGAVKLQRLLQRLFISQAREVASKVNLDRGTAPDMSHWVDVVAEVVKPSMLAAYQDGMKRAAGRIARTGKVKAFGNRRRLVLVTKSLSVSWYKEPGNRAPIMMVPITSVGGTHDPGYSQTASDRWAGQLAESIKRSGRVQALTAIEEGGGYRITDGKHRLQACSALGIATVGIQVRNPKHKGLLSVVTKAKSKKPDVTVDFDLFQPKVLDAVQRATYDFCRETMDTAAGDIKEALVKLRALMTEGLPRGDAIQLLARQVREIFADPARAFRIATTETSRAMHAGGRMAGEESGVVTGWTWLASSDACELCLSLDGKTVQKGQPYYVDPKGGAYAVVMHPPLHPHCFL